jgi:FlaA1/EpsC-like NDP-sugar epimerase
VRRILLICERIRVRAQMIPAFFDLLQGKVSISSLREVRVEDLLNRETVSLEAGDLRAFLGGRAVLVTGAGGSIGAELARQAARFRPSRLILLDRAEPALYEIDRELREAWPELRILPVMGDVTDRERMLAVFREHAPRVVAHAAAHKHVPLMETNAPEAVKNNVFGTLTVAEVAGECGAEAFILISTDKAVRPSSVMGATKRVAELVVQGLGHRYATRYVAVRFGNVLGSAGSVIPLFREQIARGGPVTITHPDMKRYFMTIPEAAVLTLQAGAMGRGGEIFVLDMGEPVKISYLAEQMIRLSGREPGQDIPIEYIGLRPGEKLYEELFYDSEDLIATDHPKIRVARGSDPLVELATADRLAVLARACDVENSDTILAALAELVPGWGRAPLGPVPPGPMAVAADFESLPSQGANAGA